MLLTTRNLKTDYYLYMLNVDDDDIIYYLSRKIADPDRMIHDREFIKKYICYKCDKCIYCNFFDATDPSLDNIIYSKFGDYEILKHIASKWSKRVLLDHVSTDMLKSYFERATIA
nr:MAG: hypothetical protein [Helarchaeota virus Nidhogg Meg22_1012]